MSPTGARGARSDALMQEIREEFPTFCVLYKDESGLQKAIDRFLRVVTLGGMRSYLSHYHTVLFGKLWVCRAWDRMSDEECYVLLRHERVHLRQRARYGEWGMALRYLFGGLPLGACWGRARIEWEAYEETLRATHEVFGEEAMRALRPWLLARFSGPDYGWMWPFEAQVGRWFDRTVADTLFRSAAGAARVE